MHAKDGDTGSKAGRDVVVQVRTTIARPAWEVRDQFRDVTYHTANPVHADRRVAVVRRRAGTCRYRQILRVGPVRVRNELLLVERDGGSLEHEVVRGPLSGALVHYGFEWNGPSSTGVAVTATFDSAGLRRLVTPLVRRVLRRALERMLAEDREDLEAGRYTRLGSRPLHPSFG